MVKSYLNGREIYYDGEQWRCTDSNETIISMSIDEAINHFKYGISHGCSNEQAINCMRLALIALEEYKQKTRTVDRFYGKSLRDILKFRNMTQKDLAKKLAKLKCKQEGKIGSEDFEAYRDNLVLRYKKLIRMWVSAKAKPREDSIKALSIVLNADDF